MVFADEPPRKRGRTQKRETPHQLRARATQEDHDRIEPDEVDFDVLRKRDLKSFVPVEGEFLFHDFPTRLPRQSTTRDRKLSVCEKNSSAMSGTSVVGSDFIRKQMPYIRNWSPFSRTNLKKWTKPFDILDVQSGYHLDNFIFVWEDTIPFVACGWDGHTYTWMNVFRGFVIDIPENCDWSRDIRVFMPPRE